MDTAEQERKQLWRMWVAMGTGPLLLLLVATIMKFQGLVPMVAEMDDFVPILGTVGISLMGVSFVAPGLLRGRAVPPAPDAEEDEAAGDLLAAEAARHFGSFRTAVLVGWGLAEGGALVSLIGVLYSGFQPLLLAGIALFPVCMLITAPTISRLAGFLRDRLLDAGYTMEQVETYLARLG